ncbi:signal-transduction and transcriptional-control protein [Deltaproteobacteria bacterium]|nr:signal-transduction and transcriptional-control protein [Deltaproteobacteria bacterium]
MSSNFEYQERLKEIRQAFQSGLPFDESLVRPAILDSWKRSREYGVVMGNLKNISLTPEQLEVRIRERKAFCDVAFPTLLSLYEFTNGSKLLSQVCDEEGYILKMEGENYFDFIPPEFRPWAGCSRNEKLVGTNGIGTVLSTGKPMQVIGLEHYYTTYWDYTCSGAPIFDPEGKIIGIFCLAGPNEHSKLHTLGLSIAIATIISRELKLKKNSKQIESAYIITNAIKNRLQIILEAVTSGLLLLDKNLKIIHSNKRAYSILGCNEEQIIGNDIRSIFDGHVVSAKSIAKGFNEKYITSSIGELPVDLSVTAEPTDSGECLIMFDTVTALHKKVNTVVGKNAYFTFEDILGNAQRLRKVVGLSQIAATGPSNVLLTGESGTGKELFAHAIHNASARRNGPFVSINCGAIPKTLIESELFGYEPGSFTGAKRDGSAGKFELADGGTIFLDEIGDMPFDVQSTLLRVLQSKEIIRIGGSRTKKVDVRIIAATNKDLLNAIALQTFRTDLFYRLNVFNIEIPPLRERGGDIRILAAYFLEKYARHAHKSLPIVTDNVYTLLESFGWPGNVRELENVIERAVYISDGFIDEQCLPDYIVVNRGRSGGVKQAAGTVLASSQETFEEDEKNRLIRTLRIENGDVSRVAELIGLSRRTLYRRLKKYGISRLRYFS